MPRTHRIEDGLFVRQCAGEEAGARLLWLHGLGESGLCFEEVVRQPALVGRTHRIPDLPGYGRSAWPAQPLSLEQTVDRLAVSMATAPRAGTGPSSISRAVSPS